MTWMTAKSFLVTSETEFLQPGLLLKKLKSFLLRFLFLQFLFSFCQWNI